jgi:signal transduction histidine kinase
MTRTGESVDDECRRVAELLDLDAVGVSIIMDGDRQAASWAVEGAAFQPADLEAVVAGAVDGWIGARLDDGSIVFGRLTPSSSARAGSVLRAIGPSMVQALWEESSAPAAIDTQPDPHSPVHRVLAATRRVLSDPEATVPDLLFALREALGAGEVYHLVDGAAELQVTSSPVTDRTRRIPREIRAKVRELPPAQPLQEATARQLAVVLGATTPFVSAAFCSDEDTAEVLLVGWREDAAVSPAAVGLIARVVGAARTALDTRSRAVETLLLRERNRWAYEIHDGVTQAVTTSVLELEALTHKIQRDPKEAIETLAVSKSEIRKALSELRGILFELSKERSAPPTQDEPLTKYVQDVVRRWRLPARVTVKGDLHDVPKPLLGAAYVVVRESLANAAKHAGARNVTVWVSAAQSELTVEVADTGKGFSTHGPRADREGRHFGLEMMQKRISEVGGTLEVDSAPGRGTRVTARLPIDRESGDG